MILNYKPYIDRVLLNCPSWGERNMKRVAEVIDAGLIQSRLHNGISFENKETLNQNSAILYEAIDQTRGWFYTLLAISTLLFDEPSAKLPVFGCADKYGQK